jgi:hypothetical protein
MADPTLLALVAVLSYRAGCTIQIRRDSHSFATSIGMAKKPHWYSRDPKRPTPQATVVVPEPSEVAVALAPKEQQAEAPSKPSGQYL